MGRAMAALTVLITIMSPILAATPIAPDEMQAFQTAISARLEKMQNLLVDYIEEIQYDPYPEVLGIHTEIGPDRPAIPITGIQKLDASFGLLNGSARYESRMSEETSQRYAASEQDFLREDIRVYGPERTEQLLVHANRPRPMGLISGQRAFPDSAIDIAMGLRGREERDWLDPEALTEAEMSKLPNGNLVATLISGQYRHEWEHDPRQGFMLVAYRAVMKESGRLILESAASGFQLVEGQPMPNEIVETEHSYAYETHRAIRTRRLHLERIEIGASSNVPDKYKIVWPRGTNILDQRINLAFYIDSGDRDLMDQSISDATIRSKEFSALASSQPSTQPGSDPYITTSRADDIVEGAQPSPHNREGWLYALVWTAPVIIFAGLAITLKRFCGKRNVHCQKG